MQKAIDEDVKAAPGGSYSFPGKTRASFALPSDTLIKKTVIKIMIRRRGCEKIIDTVSASLAANANLPTEVNSQNGLFKAVIWHDQITLQPT